MMIQEHTAPGPPCNLRCEYLEAPLGIDVQRPRLSWQVDDTRRGAVQEAYEIAVASSVDALPSGDDSEANVWSTGRVASSDNAFIEYAGPALSPRTTYHWRVRTWDTNGEPSPWSDPAWWETGLLTSDGFNGQWLVPPHDDTSELYTQCPYFRRSFTILSKPRRVRLYVAARGIAQCFVNGQPVTKNRFDPGCSDFNKRARYRTYDVTGLVNSGDNAVGAILANGWYCGLYNRGDGRDTGGRTPQLLAQLIIDYDDGSTDTIMTDDSWRMTMGGPHVSGDFYLGETYDARRELHGWSASGFDDTAWTAPRMQACDGLPISAHPGPPVRNTRQLTPVDVTRAPNGSYLFDMGQNMVGVVQLRVEAPEGTTITLRHAEILEPDGNIYTTNLRGAISVDKYTCRGGGVETYEPMFTFHGFRYVELSGWPDAAGAPPVDTVTGRVMHSDLPMTSMFECSHPMVNQLQSNIVWCQRGNYLELPTDCPQRDERMGWLGDAQVFVRTGCFNMDSGAFYTKWLEDIRDAQCDDGAYTDTVPLGYQAAHSAAWVEAGVICPWTIYLCYGDRRILEEHYESMLRFMAWLQETSDDFIRPNTGYGDWLNIDDDTPRDLIGTAFFAHAADLMSRIAGVLGRADDQARYGDLFAQVKDAYNKTFITPAGVPVADSQCACVLSLAFHLVGSDVRTSVAARLLELLEQHDVHLSTGFLGTPMLLHVLAVIGRTDLAYKLLLRDTFPSWGYTIKHGATTIWERWDGWTQEKGFQDPNMNSFNHYAFGAVGGWMYQKMAGIDLDEAQPGYRHIVIHPRPLPGSGITHTSAAYDSIHGRIESAWRNDGDQFTIDVMVPANTCATVIVPAASADDVREGNTPVRDAEGVVAVSSEGDSVAIEISAGAYSFTMPWATRAIS